MAACCTECRFCGEGRIPMFDINDHMINCAKNPDRPKYKPKNLNLDTLSVNAEKYCSEHPILSKENAGIK